jgi:hypothetical protein
VRQRIFSSLRIDSTPNIGAMPSFSRRRFLQLSSLAALSAPLTVRAIEPSKPLFDGKTLKGWSPTGFGPGGEVKAENGQIIIEAGDPLSGIKIDGEPPARMNYEISYEAMRLEGDDFFCALTVPVDQACCTLVIGGWGGTLVGISSIDGFDASENATTQHRKFEPNRWYRIRFRVTPKKLETWIDDKQVIDANIEGKKIGMRRGQIEMSQPLGFSNYRAKSALRNINFQGL